MSKKSAKRTIAALIIGAVTMAMLPVVGFKMQAKSDSVMPLKIFRPGFNTQGSLKLMEPINKKFGTDISFVDSGWDNYTQKAALMITTGDDTDWVNVEATQPYNEWGSSGLLYDLAPIIKANAKDLPNLNLIAFSKTFAGYRGDKGEVYGIPAIAFGQNNGLEMRQDWLDKAKLNAPKTLDQIYVTLKKFKDMKLGGPGAYPMVANSQGSFNWVFSANGVPINNSPTGKLMFKRNGTKYEIATLDAGTKRSWEYINKLVTNGLVNPDWLSLGGTGKHQDMYKAGKAGMIYDSSPYDEVLYKVDPTYRNVWLDAPKGPTGIQSYGGNSPMWLLMTITKHCKDPLKALKVAEYMLSKEGRLLTCYGIKGVHYGMDAKGVIDNTSDIYVKACKQDFPSDGYPPTFWGFVSAFGGYMDTTKYKTFESAYKNMVIFPVKLDPTIPVHNNYNGWVAHVQKFIDVYEFSAYNIEDLKPFDVSLSELQTNYFIKAVTGSSSNVDKLFDDCVKDTMKNGGTEAIKIFTDYMNKKVKK